MVLFLEEYSDEDLQTTLAKCYMIQQRKLENLKTYFKRFQKYLKQHDMAVEREVAIKFSKKIAAKRTEQQTHLFGDLNVLKKERKDSHKQKQQNLI